MEIDDRLLDKNSIQQDELRGFSRSMAELEWLLLILVLMYFMIPGNTVTENLGTIIAITTYAVFILAFRYLNFYRKESRWKLAVQTWVMIIFITYVLWNTGKIDSPLLNLYLLVIIASALTLGKMMTILEVLLITSCYLYMGYLEHSDHIFSFQTFSIVMSSFVPFLLVAYITTMLAADMHFSRARITRLSLTDDLTGLLNMRAFNDILNREINKTTRYASSFSVMMIDVDGLKSVNDRFGHTTGSRLVKTVGDTISSCLRSTDVLARYGGDEFIALLSEIDMAGSCEVAERIRSAIQNTSFDMQGQSVSTTASIGVACYPYGDMNARNILENSDAALYQSKNSGKNRITFHGYKDEYPPGVYPQKIPA